MDTYFALVIPLFIIFGIGIIGNFFVIGILSRQRHNWGASITYLFNLAVADFLFTSSIPFWAHYYLNQLNWSFGLVMCKTTSSLTSINMYATVLFLTAMSIDRWMAVVHGIKLRHLRTRKIAGWVCMGIWLAALLFSLPSILYQTLRINPYNQTTSSTISVSLVESLELSNYSIFHNSSNITARMQIETLNRTYCFFTIPNGSSKIVIQGLTKFFKPLVGFVIPMIVICVCYVRILVTVRTKMIGRTVQKSKITKLAAYIVTAFFICWFPNQILNLLAALGGWWKLFSFPIEFYNAVYPYTVCLSWANSCINPVLYAFTNTKFRQRGRMRIIPKKREHTTLFLKNLTPNTERRTVSQVRLNKQRTTI